MREILLALPPGSDDPLASEVYRSVSTSKKKVECAGRAFSEKYGKRKTHKTKHRAESKNDDNDNDSDESMPGRTSSSGGLDKFSGFKIPPVLIGSNCYDLLGVPECASEKEIRIAYRAKAMEHHPDKQCDGSQRSEDFLKIQAAYDILSDSKSRLAYDSTLPVDDKIPTELKPGEDFFAVFSKFVGSRARFAKKQPVPRLGTAASSVSEVKRFYDYWTHEYESMRDFSHMQTEYDISTASNRDERRWMQKQIALEVREEVENERERIATLVATLKKLDPRLASMNLFSSNDKKVSLKDLKADVWKVAKSFGIDQSPADTKVVQRYIELKCVSVELTQAVIKKLQSLTNKEAVLDEMVQAVKAADATIVTSKPANSQEPTVSAAKPSSTMNGTSAKDTLAQSSLIWTRDDLALLSKLMVEKPIGTQNRFEKISEGMKHRFSAEEVARVGRVVASQSCIGSELLALVNSGKKDQPTGASAAPSVDVGSSSCAASTPVKETEWSVAEQKKLEEALKKFPPKKELYSTDRTRWHCVSELVGTRTPAECSARFAKLKDALKAGMERAKESVKLAFNQRT